MKKFIYLSIFTLSTYVLLGQDTPSQDTKPTAERHEFVQRGNHAKEMGMGDYVIVGVFKTEVDARQLVEEFKKIGFSETSYGYLTNKGSWYLHMSALKDIDEAKMKRDRYRKEKPFKDAWLLTVHQ